MALNRRVPLLLATTTLVLIGCQTTPRSGEPSLGELEHRGKRYALRDLTNPTYRATSKEAFVRDFNIDTLWAQMEADLTRE